MIFSYSACALLYDVARYARIPCACKMAVQLDDESVASFVDENKAENTVRKTRWYRWSVNWANSRTSCDLAHMHVLTESQARIQGGHEVLLPPLELAQLGRTYVRSAQYRTVDGAQNDFVQPKRERKKYNILSASIYILDHT